MTLNGTMGAGPSSGEDDSYDAFLAAVQARFVEGRDDAEACGISLHKNAKWDHTFRATTKQGVTLSYKLDRWD